MSFQAADSFDPKTWFVILGAAALVVAPSLLSGRKAFFAGLGSTDSDKAQIVNSRYRGHLDETAYDVRVGQHVVQVIRSGNGLITTRRLAGPTKGYHTADYEAVAAVKRAEKERHG